ncbi:MAG: universal stress protein, partial [Gemmataceae bacterium]
CHHLIHYDLPWSLIRIEQRNGRIDRYGQEYQPQFAALVLTSQTDGAKDDTTVAEKLLAKEEEAHRSLGTAEGVTRLYSARKEEDRLVKDLLAGKTVEESIEATSDDDDFLADLIGGVGAQQAQEPKRARVPKLFKDTKSFADEALRFACPDLHIDDDGTMLAFGPPEDLIQRLKDGKVYLPQQAERAVRNYFRPGNLTALRELALRRTAQRVDEQMVTYMRAHAISGPWAAAERVLVCINEDPSCAAVIRHARRLADRLRTPWTAIHIETSRALRLSGDDRDRIADCLRLAQRLGGEAVTMPGPDVAIGIVEYAQANNFTHIIIAKSRRSRWSEWLRGSVTHRLIRLAGDISVHVIAKQKEQTEPLSEKVERRARKRATFDTPAYAGTILIVAIALVIGLVLKQYLAISNVALVFLTAVLASAVTYGLWPSLFA